jgi:hypothetical protein
MTGSNPKPPPSMEEVIVNLSAQVEKLDMAYTSVQDELTTVKGDNNRLLMAVNRLQSDKIDTSGGSASLPRDNHDGTVQAAKYGHKLLFSTFDGTDDPLQWLNQCDQFFRIQETSASGKVFLATFYMTGEAAQWYDIREPNHGQPSWEEFVTLVNQHFGLPLRSNLLGELIQLQRDDSVIDYQSAFLTLVARCDDLTEKQHINIFTVGLRNPLCTDVELEHPTTLEDAMALAQVYEQRLTMVGDLPARAKSVPARIVNKPLLLSAPPSAVASKDAASGAPVTAPRFKLLTPAEMAAKREKNECFNCPAQFSWEHLKVCPMKGIFLLHMKDDSPLEKTEEVDEPRVSLHAITGLTVVEMM